MNNEKYGIELELKTQQFSKQIAFVKNKMQDIADTLAMADKGYEVGDVFKLESEYESLNNKLIKLTKSQEEYNSEQSKSGSIGLSAGNKISKSLDNMTKKAERFILSLISVRSIFSLLSRASSQYISTNEELSQKMQSAWAGLGALLAPILEGIANAILKLVGYINVFISALTGTNYLAKASKNFNNLNKSAKATSKTLASFDTISNLSSSSGGGLAQYNPFDGFEDGLDSNVVSGIEKVAKKIKDLWKFIKEQIQLGKQIWGPVFSWIGEQIEFGWGNLKKVFGWIWEQAKLGVQIWQPIFTWIGEQFKTGWNNIKNIFTWVKDRFGELTSFVKSQIELSWNYFKNTWLGQKLISAVDGLKTKFTSISIGYMEGLSNAWEKTKSFFSNISFKIGTFSLTMQDKLITGFKSVLNTVLKFFINQLNITIKSFNTFSKWVSKNTGINLGTITAITVPQLATGTNYVPQDQLAMIHKGEAVVPKKFNSKEYFNGNGSDETNALLKTLISTLENKDTNVYMDGNKVGQSVTNYINSQSRIMGRSVI